MISDGTGLNIVPYLAREHGGIQQIQSLVSNKEVDLLFFFRDPDNIRGDMREESNLFRICDKMPIPYATNLATADALILCLDRGDLDWRDFVLNR
jgi:methylglyoxal synthase